MVCVGCDCIGSVFLRAAAVAKKEFINGTVVIKKEHQPLDVKNKSRQNLFQYIRAVIKSINKIHGLKDVTANTRVVKDQKHPKDV